MLITKACSTPTASEGISNSTVKMGRSETISKSKENDPLQNKDRQMLKACSEFESLFISLVLKEMRATVPKSGFISGGAGEEIFTSLMDSELAKDVSQKGGIGFTSLLMNQFRDHNPNLPSRK